MVLLCNEVSVFSIDPGMKLSMCSHCLYTSYVCRPGYTGLRSLAVVVVRKKYYICTTTPRPPCTAATAAAATVRAASEEALRTD